MSALKLTIILCGLGYANLSFNQPFLSSAVQVASAALLKPPTKPKGKKDSGKKGKGRAKTKAAN